MPVLPMDPRIFAYFSGLSVAVSLADPAREDCPLIYDNDAFTDVTGYAAEDAVGRNCRFLQCPEADQSAIEALRAAVRDRRPSAHMLRYKCKDGTPFDNFLLITNLEHDGRDYLMGCQHALPAARSAHAAEAQLSRVNMLAHRAAGRIADELRIEALRLSSEAIFALVKSYLAAYASAEAMGRAGPQGDGGAQRL